MKKVAVILSGCGVFDGAEIHESVLTLLNLEKAGASYQCFAPNIDQFHVINHISGEEQDERRNVLVEAARIARGEIADLETLNADEFDALVLPGGFGVAKNLSDFAFKGADSTILECVKRVCREFNHQQKPIAYLCIAPALIAHIHTPGTLATIGNDVDTAAAINTLGAKHVDCEVTEIVVDDNEKVISTPAYMLASSILEAATGIEKAVVKLIEMA
ncbi:MULTISPECIES: isoprenoid biosynthesis glyoxalase ElbB [Pseudoalteromonas]|uniref:isoprenoid biosynthesis glyoxalase ElbB n=1 Tax=Pseudoalteromonas TaxID=53246 RepID=UPI000FFF5F1A|nr:MULTISPECIES: isoprenoid biosynthesis glyoxalase ElbB [Pseudoalteromonas]MCG9757878.1 isoprenoid biosynthesis glyoxalase ElbB [Pseudoalteromonas sp. Isolate6]NKC20680.1 isoprenoid biosynthesis glyoxalase ElbB [Pseudoalteromonas galatheae]RXE88172.1 isoprenoid biosynthesis protein ElbB [Pseudoalteromonas sp. A757]